MLNKVQIIGNVGQVEIRQSNGKKVASFSIATNENYKDKNGNKVTKVNWFRVAAFSDHYVELIEKYVKKVIDCLLKDPFKIQVTKKTA